MHKIGSILALTVLARFPLLIYPRAIDDERIYSVVALEMLNGGVPYIDAIERKPPLLFWVYEIIFEVGGSYNWHWLHFVGTLWVLLTALGLYYVAKLLFDKHAGAMSALLYVIFVSWGDWENLALNGEILMNLPVVWGIYLALRASTSGRLIELFGSGMLLGSGFLLKQPAAIMAVPIGLYLLLPAYRKNMRGNLLTSLCHVVFLTAGFLAILSVAVFVLWHQGNLKEAFYWTYTNHQSPHTMFTSEFWMRGLRKTLEFMVVCGPLVLGTYVCIKRATINADGLWKGKSAELTALLLLLVAALIGLSASGRFYSHYFIQIVPILCLFSGPVFSAVLLSGDKVSGMWALEPLILRRWLLANIMLFLCVYVVGFAQNWNIDDVSKYVMENTGPDDKIFVWGQRPGIYVDSQRRPAARYVATFPLTGYVFGTVLNESGIHDTLARVAPGAWENLKMDFRKHLPKLIIDTEGSKEWVSYPITHSSYLRNTLDQCFLKEKVLPGGIVYRAREESCPAVSSLPNSEGIR